MALKEIVTMLAKLSAPIQAMAQRQQPLNIAKSLLSTNYAIVNIFSPSVFASYLERVQAEYGSSISPSKIRPLQFRLFEKYLEPSPGTQSQMGTGSMPVGRVDIQKATSKANEPSPVPIAAVLSASQARKVHSSNVPLHMAFPNVALLLHNAVMRIAKQETSIGKGAKDSSVSQRPFYSRPRDIESAEYFASKTKLPRIFELSQTAAIRSWQFDEKVHLLRPSVYAPITKNWMTRIVPSLRKDRLPKYRAMQTQSEDGVLSTNVGSRRIGRPAKMATDGKSLKLRPSTNKGLETHADIHKKDLSPVNKSRESSAEKIDTPGSQVEVSSAQDVMKMPGIIRGIVVRLSSKRYPPRASLLLPYMPVASPKRSLFDSQFPKEGTSSLQSNATLGETKEINDIYPTISEPRKRVSPSQMKKISPGKMDASTSRPTTVSAKLTIDTVFSSVLGLPNIIGLLLKLGKTAGLLSVASLHGMLSHGITRTKSNNVNTVVGSTASVLSDEYLDALSPASMRGIVSEKNPLDSILLLTSSSMVIAQSAKESLEQSIRNINLQSTVPSQLSKAKQGKHVKNIDIGTYRTTKRSRNDTGAATRSGTIQPLPPNEPLKGRSKTVQRERPGDSLRNDHERSSSNFNIGSQLTVNPVARLQNTYSKYILHNMLGKERGASSRILIGDKDYSMRLLSAPGRKFNSKGVKNEVTLIRKMRDGSIDLPLMSQLQGILTNHVIHKTNEGSSGSAAMLSYRQVLSLQIPSMPSVFRSSMPHQSFARAGTIGYISAGEQPTATPAFKTRELEKQTPRHDNRYGGSSTRLEKTGKGLSLRDLRKMMEQIFQEELKRYGL